MMNTTDSNVVMNKFTNRYLKKGTRSYTQYLKKLKREAEDEAMIKAQVKKARKRAVLAQADMLSSDDEQDPGPALPRKVAVLPVKQQNTQQLQQQNTQPPNAKHAMEELYKILEGIDETTPDADEQLRKMFDKLLN